MHWSSVTVMDAPVMGSTLQPTLERSAGDVTVQHCPPVHEGARPHPASAAVYCVGVTQLESSNAAVYQFAGVPLSCKRVRPFHFIPR